VYQVSRQGSRSIATSYGRLNCPSPVPGVPYLSKNSGGAGSAACAGSPTSSEIRIVATTKNVLPFAKRIVFSSYFWGGRVLHKGTERSPGGIREKHHLLCVFQAQAVKLFVAFKVATMYGKIYAKLDTDYTPRRGVCLVPGAVVIVRKLVKTGKTRSNLPAIGIVTPDNRNR
jgi:hypothetical protein